MGWRVGSPQGPDSDSSKLSSKVPMKERDRSRNSRIWNASVQAPGVGKDSTWCDGRPPSPCACLQGDSVRLGELEVPRDIKGPDE